MLNNCREVGKEKEPRVDVGTEKGKYRRQSGVF